ncbi:MAG: Ldh family oxidoreductase [Candidatus Dojkabacteria bacterium]|nr:MAG: Ldh family oxidoreductase [Candidatus Dojkabacteria bacterium]
MKVKLTDLESLVSKALLKYGYSEEEAKVIQKILLFAQLRGNNQGVVKLIGNGIPRNPEGVAPTIEKETPVSALVNGNSTHAMVVMDMLVDIAIGKAEKSGIGIAGNYNGDASTGAIGYYVNRIAEKGLIGIAFASAPFQTTAPYGATEAKFCTNPMAYGIPTEGDPIILDMSTSTMAYYGLIEAETAGKDVPEGTGYDKDGKETTDPAEIMSGALKTFGGHKGSGLALIVQIFAGALVNADSFNNDSENAGNLVIAIDPAIFLTQDDFKKRVSEIVANVKSARKLEGVDEILIPGERGNKVMESAMKRGEIEIEENLYKELMAVAK